MTVADIAKRDNVITLDKDASIKDSFKKLFNANVSSAPVLDSNGKIFGILDVVDILVFTLAICKTSQELVEFLGLRTSTEAFIDFSDFGPSFLSDQEKRALLEGTQLESTGFVTNFTSRKPVILSPSDTFSDLIKALSAEHRVIVVDGEQIVNYITQSDLVKYLHARGNIFCDQTLQDMGIDQSSVVSTKSTSRVIEAFKAMAVQKTRAVAVLDEDGHLVGDISAKDIRGATESANLVDRLYYYTYPEYVKSMEHFNEDRECLKVNPTTTLRNLVDLLVSKPHHHAYVVDGDKLTGVISLGDLIKLV